MDDLEAIRQIKKGNISGLETLIARYQHDAMRVAILVTRDEPLSEDVVQDAFLRFYTQINRFDEKRPFAPYFMTCVMNAALNALKKSQRTQSMDFDADEATFENLLEQSTSVESEVERFQLRKEMGSVLANLSPRQRMVLVQRYYLEMSEKEMSDFSNCSPGTIKWLLNAARNRLRGLIQERMEE